MIGIGFLRCPICGLLLLVLIQVQKKGFGRQQYSKSESVREGIALGDAVHLVHTVLKFLQRYFLLFCKRSVRFLTVPGDQL